MLSIPSSTKIFICTQPVDMRYSFDALSGLVQTHFGLNPLNGHLFVFFSKRRDRMKILAWDVDGFLLYYKRLEEGSFSWLDSLQLLPGGEILAADFSLVLAGINPTDVKRSKRYRRLPLNSEHLNRSTVSHVVS
jgi:transposase